MPQRSVLNRVFRRVSQHGRPAQMDGAEALAGILKSTDLYTCTPTNVKPYHPEKFHVLSSGRNITGVHEVQLLLLLLRSTKLRQRW